MRDFGLFSPQEVKKFKEDLKILENMYEQGTKKLTDPQIPEVLRKLIEERLPIAAAAIQGMRSDLAAIQSESRPVPLTPTISVKAL